MRRQRDSVLYERAQQPGLAARRIAQAGDAGAQPVGRGVRAIVIGITGIGPTHRQRMSTEGSRRRALEAVPVRVADTAPPGIRPLAGHKVEIIGAASLAVKHIEATERQVELTYAALSRQTDTHEPISTFGLPTIHPHTVDQAPRP